MKRKEGQMKKTTSAGLAIMFCAVSAYAADGTWTRTNVHTNWSDTSSWAGGVIADGIGATASIQANIAAARTITIDTTSRTLGYLNIGDPTANYFAFTIAASGGASLIFDNGAGAAQINKTVSTAADRINAPMVLNSSLDIYNSSAGDLQLYGAISAGTSGIKTISNLSTGTNTVGIGSGTTFVSDGNGTVAINQQSASSKMILATANTYSGTTTIGSGATLQVGTGGNNGKVGTGSIFNDGTLLFNRTGAAQIDDVMSGTGQLVLTNTVLLKLLQNNTYSGLTTIESGATLQLGQGSGAGSLGSGDVVNNGKITVIRSNTIEINNAISGSGILEKSGTPGTLILSGVSTYTNVTDLLSGSMVINGSLQSAMITAASGTTLMGTGTVQSVTMNAGSILAAGNSPGTMTFQGDLMLSAGSTNLMEIASASSYDQLMGSDVNTLTAAGAIIFDFTGASVSAGDTFAVFDSWGTLANGGATVSIVGIDESLINTDDLFSTGLISVIPEPATIGMLWLGALITMLVRRRTLR